MSNRTLLHALFHHKASIDNDLLDALASLPEDGTLAAMPTALRILNHATIVDEIFIAHLQEKRHAFEKTWRDEIPALPDLARRLRAADQWYLAYTKETGADDLETSIDFAFTDGQHGRMSRAEMLAHVVTHSGFHRGELARLLPEIKDVSMCDVFAGFLHRAEPDRRALNKALA